MFNTLELLEAIIWPRVPTGMLVYFEVKVAPAIGGINCLHWVLVVNTHTHDADWSSAWRFMLF